MDKNLTEKEKKLYKIFQYSKLFPEYGAYKLLGIWLPWYQIDMLRRVWFTKFPLFLASRRTGKSFIIAIALTLRALLYSNMDIGLVAPVYRQSKNQFKLIEDIVKKSPFASSQLLGEARHGSSEWAMYFKRNSSSVIAVPLSNNIRSYDFSLIHIDEYGFREGMNQDVGAIIEPMILIKRSLKTGQKQETTDIGNQIIISSTANFEGSDFHVKVREYQDLINKGDKDYDIISYDYRQALEAGIFEEKVVKKKVEQADSYTRMSEYLNVFIAGGKGFITYDLIQKKMVDKEEIVDADNDIYIPPKTKLEFEQKYDKDGNPVDKYALIFDDADQGNDNFSYILVRMDKNIKRAVKVEAVNNAPVQEKIRVIRDILRKFNVVLMGCDQRHKNITDNLMEKYTYLDGEVGKPILIKGDESQIEYIQNLYDNDVDYDDIIVVHNFGGSSNELRARHFLSEIEKGRFKIPASINIETKEEEYYHNEFKKMIAEIVSIEPQPLGKYIQYKPKKSSFRKDRWTCAELSSWLIDEYIKEQTNNSGDFYVGYWRK